MPAPEAFESLNPCLAPFQVEAEPFASTNVSEVFRAEWPSSTMAVAIKVAKFGHQGHILKEAELTPQIVSPSVFPVVASGTINQPGTRWDRRAYVVSPFNDGGTLEDFMVSDEETAVTAWVALKQAAFGLKAIHDHGYVHGDFKPTNVFIDANQRGFTADLGLAVPIGKPISKRPSADGKIYSQGTIGYMSPDQMKNKRLDESADVYSLAATAIKSLTGQYPWLRYNIEGVPQSCVNSAIETQEEEPVEPMWPSYVPANLRRALRSCLQPLASYRPDLDELLAVDFGSPAEETTTPPLAVVATPSADDMPTLGYTFQDRARLLAA